MDYFEARNNEQVEQLGYTAPKYLTDILNLNKSQKILDFGCGKGKLLIHLYGQGLKNLYAVDINQQALSKVQEAVPQIKTKLISDFHELGDADFGNFDCIILSHVLEHFPKDLIVPFLTYLRTNILAKNGTIYLMVPNAQSATGAYWAYEDFTHHLLFTSGSVNYVAQMAGYKNIEFLDVDCMTGLSFKVRLVKSLLLKIYKIKNRLWQFATSSNFHGPSPMILSYEIKATLKE